MKKVLAVAVALVAASAVSAQVATNTVNSLKGTSAAVRQDVTANKKALTDKQPADAEQKKAWEEKKAEHKKAFEDRKAKYENLTDEQKKELQAKREAAKAKGKSAKKKGLDAKKQGKDKLNKKKADAKAAADNTKKAVNEEVNAWADTAN